MALVGTAVDNTWWYSGGKKHRLFNVAETSYTANGSTPAVANFAGYNSITQVIPLGVSSNGHTWRWDGTKVRAYKLNAAAGLVPESFPDILGGKFANQVAGGTAATNEAHIIALVTATTAPKTTIVKQPNDSASTPGNSPAGRNVVVSFESTAGLTLPADMGTATVVGTDQFGVAQTEVISLAALNGVALTAAQRVYIVGTKAFGTVTSLTLSVDVTVAGANDARVALGIGTVLGLRGKITAESDIKSVRKDNADVTSATYVGSATTHSLDPGADIADDVDFLIVYDGLASSLIDREAAASANVGTVLCEVVGLG